MNPAKVVVGFRNVNEAGTHYILTDREATPALGLRSLQSYVPLRCIPNESVSGRNYNASGFCFVTKLNFYLVSEFFIYQKNMDSVLVGRMSCDNRVAADAVGRLAVSAATRLSQDILPTRTESMFFW